LLAGAALAARVALLGTRRAAARRGGAGGSASGASSLGGGPASPDAKDGLQYAFAAKVGTCLMWQRDDAADMKPVNCEELHVFEVTQVTDISSKYPAGAPLPDTETWRRLAKQRCTKGAERYLDNKLDP